MISASRKSSAPGSSSSPWSLWHHPGGWQGLFLGQLLFLGWESFREVHGFWLSHDFAAYWQAVWWIGAHHRLWPPDSVFGFPALANNAEWILLPIGILAYPLWPHPTLLLILQDLAVVAAGWMAWRWAATLTRPLAPALRGWLLGCTVFLLAGNIWIVRADTFDFHPESLAAVAVLGAARALAEHRPRALAAWTIGLLSCGTIGGILAVGLAGSALLQRQWRPMGGLASAGALFLAGMGALHWNQGSVLRGSYGYLWGLHPPAHVSAWTVAEGILAHPRRALWAVWGNRGPALLNLLPAGGIGGASVAVIGPVGLWLLVNNLVHPHLGTSFSQPGFQFLPIYPLMTVGLIEVVQRGEGATHRPIAWVTRSLLGFALLATAGLAWILGPAVLIPAPTPPAQELAQILRRTPPTQEVIASQQAIGRFGGRPWVYAIMRAQRIPLHTPQVTVIILPGWGHHVLPTRDQQAEVRDLVHNPAAHLVAHRDGVWWFVVRTPATPWVFLPYPPSSLPSIYGYHASPAP